MTNNLDYPNMEFPYKYTKSGQKELIEKYTQTQTLENQTIEKSENSVINNKTNNENDNSNIVNLLQALLSKPQKVETMDTKSSGIDMSKLLSMLINKDFKQKDLLNMLIPLLTNNQNTNSSQNTINAESTILPTKTPLFKSGYKKVE